MESIQSGYRGLAFLLRLNSDRFLYLATVAFALCAGTFVGTLFLNVH